MWRWIMDMHPLTLVGFLALCGGAIMLLGLWVVERGFRRQWELPAEPDTLPARYSAGVFPGVSLTPPPADDQRTLDPAWRDALVTTGEWAAWDAARAGRGGRHRWDLLGEATRPLTTRDLEGLKGGDRATREEGPGYHPWEAEGVRSAEVPGHDEEEGGPHRQRW
jgi:hypothetical protein